jgi:hypothetical protein
MRKYAQMHLITGYAILDEPYELPLNRLPIIRMSGPVTWVGERPVRHSLTRFAKDPQRLKNYWRSVAAELLAKSPRNQWIGPADAFEGYEEDFREAHLSGDPVLKYNPQSSSAPTPMRQPEFPAAIIQEAQINTQEMKDVTGIHDASFGIRSNETSGIAIQRRQQEGDIATMGFRDNINAVVQEVGAVINDLIPLVYDTTRTVRVVGEDQQPRLIRINDPMDPESIDLSVGKYDITISTGPSYKTRRIEAAQAMIDMMRVSPQFAAVAGDLIVKAQDFPMADEIAERVSKTIPANIKGDEEGPQQPNPEQQAQLAAQQQELAFQQQKKQLELQKAVAETAEAEAQAREAEAKALRAEAEAEKQGVLVHEHERQLARNVADDLKEFSGPDLPEPGLQPQPQGIV